MLPKLYDLQLSRNRISHFEFVLEYDDDVIISPFNNNLQQLGLEENLLKTLPEEIESLKNLLTLKISSNQLETLPDSLGQLSSLENLVLDRNKLKSSMFFS